MHPLFKPLKNICQEHLTDNKILIMPSYLDGNTLKKSLSREGFSMINLRITTLFDLARDYCEEYILKNRRELADKIAIVAGPAKEDTISTIGLHLIREEYIASKLYKMYVSSEKTTIHISSTNRMHTNVWRLQIINDERVVVRQFENRGRVPLRLEWDWCDSEGKLVEPGWYSVIFRWRDGEGKLHESSKKQIRVLKRSQHKGVYVSKEIKGFDEQPEVIDIIIKEK